MSDAFYVAKNETQGKTLVRRVRRADSYLARLRGLMFRRQLGDEEGLLLVGRNESRTEASIHMFFVFFAIGVVWLDGGDRVVDKVLARPFRPFYAPQKPAIGVLECRPSILEHVEIGDTVCFSPYTGADEA